MPTSISQKPKRMPQNDRISTNDPKHPANRKKAKAKLKEIQRMPETPALRTLAPPIELTVNGAARSFAYGYPIVLLSACAMQFGSLVADTERTLLWTLVPVAALQIAYVVACLPMHGRKKAGRKSAWTWLWTVVFAALWAIAALVCGCVIAAAMVLLGAPVTDKGLSTIYCGMHMGLLSTLPALHVWGLDLGRMREVLGLERPMDQVYGGLLGTLVGAWLGAIPIPLDWDRDWQKYPITIITGAHIGHAVGLYLGAVFKGRKIHIKA